MVEINKQNSINPNISVKPMAPGTSESSTNSANAETNSLQEQIKATKNLISSECVAPPPSTGGIKPPKNIPYGNDGLDSPGYQFANAFFAQFSSKLTEKLAFKSDMFEKALSKKLSKLEASNGDGSKTAEIMETKSKIVLNQGLSSFYKIESGFWAHEAKTTYPPENQEEVTQIYKEIRELEKQYVNSLKNGSQDAANIYGQITALQTELKGLGGVNPAGTFTPAQPVNAQAKQEELYMDFKGNLAIDQIAQLQKQLADPSISAEEKAAIQAEIDKLNTSKAFYLEEEAFWNTLSKKGYPPRDAEAYGELTNELMQLEAQAEAILQESTPSGTQYIEIKKQIEATQKEIIGLYLTR